LLSPRGNASLRRFNWWIRIKRLPSLVGRRLSMLPNTNIFLKISVVLIVIIGAGARIHCMSHLLTLICYPFRIVVTAIIWPSIINGIVINLGSFILNNGVRLIILNDFLLVTIGISNPANNFLIFILKLLYALFELIKLTRKIEFLLVLVILGSLFNLFFKEVSVLHKSI